MKTCTAAWVPQKPPAAQSTAMLFARSVYHMITCIWYVLRQEGSALVSGGQDNNVMIWDVASVCNGSSNVGLRNGIDSAASLSREKKGEGENGVTAGGAVTGSKRKATVWSSTDSDPSHAPVHTFSTRNTAVYR